MSGSFMMHFDVFPFILLNLISRSSSSDLVVGRGALWQEAHGQRMKALLRLHPIRCSWALEILKNKIKPDQTR